jgi:hypothetical protein
MTESEPQLVSDFNAPLKGGRKTKKHGKRHGNASLKAWVTFVKKVAKEENLSYRDAMMRAKARKDKGEKWMKGGQDGEFDYGDETSSPVDSSEVGAGTGMAAPPASGIAAPPASGMNEFQEGGRRRRRSGRKTHRKKSHKKRRGSRRH